MAHEKPSTPVLDKLLFGYRTGLWTEEMSNAVGRINQGKADTYDLNIICEGVLQMFTANNYNAMAELVKKRMVRLVKDGDGSAQLQLSEFVNEMIMMFEADNPRFKKFQFIEAAFKEANELRATKEKT